MRNVLGDHGGDFFTPSYGRGSYGPFIHSFYRGQLRGPFAKGAHYQKKALHWDVPIRSIIANDLGMKIPPANDGLLELRVPSAARLLHIVRSVVGQVAALRGFSEEETQFVILAVDEACANVIRHAYQGSEDGVILINCREPPDGIEFLLTDFSKPADSSCWPKRSLDEMKPGGLGIPLIHAVMDQVEYRRGDGCNELLLAKTLHSSTLLARDT